MGFKCPLLKSYNYSKDNPNHILQTAIILSLNNVRFFREAKKYFLLAIKKGENDPYYKKEFEAYCTAEKCLSYFSNLFEDDFIPNHVINELRPGLSFFKFHFNVTSKEYRVKLINTLNYMESEMIGDIDDLNDIIEGFNIKGDRIIAGKYYCNLARLLYLQWYRNDALIDTNEILKIFEKSLLLNSNDPFTHCWLGTFFKEVKRNNKQADIEYRLAIRLSEGSKHEYEHNHPLFYHNLALLLMDQVTAGDLPFQHLSEAKFLLEYSMKVNNEGNYNFCWSEYSYTKCIELIEEFKIN